MGTDESRPTLDETARAEIDAVWRIDSARVIASLSRITGDVGLAEDMAQDALVAALETWPGSGIPDNPAAWLTATAKNRGIDRIRRDRVLEEKYGHLATELERRGPEPGPEKAALEIDPIGDDLMILLFTACHPALGTESQVALTLKVVGGLSTDEIARAFLVPKATVAQRIVRAKRTLTEDGIRFETPAEEELGERLGSVLGVIYLIFNEGYTATVGEEWMRPDLSAEALRLGRILVGLAPDEPEVLGLVALMEIQASRFRARLGPDGDPVLLLDQNRALWDRLLIRLGLERIRRAKELGGSGPYLLQAEIAACHARASSAGDTDWPAMIGYYDALLALNDSPVTRLNRAVAVAKGGDPDTALRLVDELAADRKMERYHLMAAVRGDLLEQLGRTEDASAEFARAASLTENLRERRVLERRAERTRIP